MEKKKHIKVSKESWIRLNQLKEPGETFDDTIKKLLDEHEEDIKNRII